PTMYIQHAVHITQTYTGHFIYCTYNVHTTCSTYYTDLHWTFHILVPTMYIQHAVHITQITLDISYT
ncbi:hypothetical protein, partial [Staphylococcus epidermidis]|uniref:hypothetical protein n=1 Tax=Staphylococcus epidermidis TaxID=1282 RepID=UPI001E43AB26